MLASAAFGGAGLGEDGSVGGQLWVQLVGVVATLIWTAVFTFIIVKVVQAVVGLKVSDDEETEGLDVTTHGERGYTL